MTDNNKAPAIVWFRRDLRIADNPALVAAAERGTPILPLFILDHRDLPGEASAWWLHESLLCLSDALRKRGVSLILRKGRPEELVPALAAGCLLEQVLRAPHHRTRQETEILSGRGWFGGDVLCRIASGRALGNSDKKRRTLQGVHAVLEGAGCIGSLSRSTRTSAKVGSMRGLGFGESGRLELAAFRSGLGVGVQRVLDTGRKRRA